RLFPEDIKKLYDNTPVKTPVLIINQPYLLGQREGWIYLAVHVSPEALDEVEFDKMYKKLKNIEKETGRLLDWARIKQVIAEARGIPVPIFEISPGNGNGYVEILEVRHPVDLYGKPEVPDLRPEAWSILAAEVEDEIEAKRLSAIINHQGPPIPARVIKNEPGYRVIAGPFNDLKEANEAIKRLKIDLEMDGKLIEPVRKRQSRGRR
ncbi:MAG: SPOR domain-containing protein, partial [Thermodesulfobacteriota bacterium]